MTGFYEVYLGVIPVDKHLKSKAATYTIENSLFRHFTDAMKIKVLCKEFKNVGILNAAFNAENKQLNLISIT